MGAREQPPMKYMREFREAYKKAMVHSISCPVTWWLDMTANHGTSRCKPRPVWKNSRPDAFAGKEFVRFITGLPVRWKKGLSTVPLRCNSPHDTLWLPDRCISYHNTRISSQATLCKSGWFR